MKIKLLLSMFLMQVMLIQSAQAYTSGIITTGQIWEDTYFAVITGDSAQTLYNFIRWGSVKSIPDILPDPVVQNKGMKCTFNENRQSIYECVFSMTKDGKIYPRM